VPQICFPIFPPGVTHITGELAFSEENGKVWYFNAMMPVFSHDALDIETFRMITSQFCVNGNVKQVDIVKAFGVSPISVKRSVKLYKEEGPGGFYKKKTPRKKTVLTDAAIDEAQTLLNTGLSLTEVATSLDLKYNTLSKAVKDGIVIQKKILKIATPTMSTMNHH
jgi:hypothetical protein